MEHPLTQAPTREHSGMSVKNVIRHGCVAVLTGAFLTVTPPAIAQENTPAGNGAGAADGAPAAPSVVRMGKATAILPQEPLPAIRAERAYLLIGGFGDEVHGIMHHLAARLRQMQPDPVAYYHWHAGRPDLPQEGLQSIARDISAFRRLNPRADIILIGHSLGAGSALKLAAALPPGQGPLYLLTLDPIDGSCRPIRPAGIIWWGNAYITHSQSGYDFLLAAGGRWNACRQADVNLRFDGRHTDERGIPYIHDHADALLLSRTLGPSLYDCLLRAMQQP